MKNRGQIVTLAVLLVVLALLLIFREKVSETVVKIVDMIRRGATITRSTQLNAAGVPATGKEHKVLVKELPESLAIEANKPLRPTSDDLNEYSAARMLASEEPRAPTIIRKAVVWALRNNAKAEKVTIHKLLTRSKTKTKDGKYSEQKGKYASTINDPTRADLELVREILRASQAEDFTRGAKQFDRPKVQRILYNQGKVDKPPEVVAADRKKSGRKLVLLPGIPEDEFRMWA